MPLINHWMTGGGLPVTGQLSDTLVPRTDTSVGIAHMLDIAGEPKEHNGMIDKNRLNVHSAECVLLKLIMVKSRLIVNFLNCSKNWSKPMMACHQKIISDRFHTLIDHIMVS